MSEGLSLTKSNHGEGGRRADKAIGNTHLCNAWSLQKQYEREWRRGELVKLSFDIELTVQVSQARASRIAPQSAIGDRINLA